MCNSNDCCIIIPTAVQYFAKIQGFMEISIFPSPPYALCFGEILDIHSEIKLQLDAFSFTKQLLFSSRPSFEVHYSLQFVKFW